MKYLIDSDEESDTFLSDIKPESNEDLPIKVIFSEFPPTLKEDKFLELVGELPPNNYYYFKGCANVGTMVSAPAVYINFLHKVDAIQWIERLNNAVFLDESGIEHYVQASIAFNQYVPENILSPKENELKGTLEETEHYQEFAQKYLESNGIAGSVLNPHGEVTIDLLLQEIEEREAARGKNEVVSPLVAYLQEKLDEKESKAKAAIELEKARQKEAKEKRKQEKQERKEKRERERKERREREKQERIAREKKQREELRRKEKERKNKALEAKKSPSEEKKVEEVVASKAVVENNKSSAENTETQKDTKSGSESSPSKEIPKIISSKSNRSASSSKRTETQDKYRRGGRWSGDRDRSKQHQRGSGTKKSEDQKPKKSEAENSEVAGAKSIADTAASIPVVSESKSSAPEQGPVVEKEKKKKIVKKIIRVKKSKSKVEESASAAPAVVESGPAPEPVPETSSSVKNDREEKRKQRSRPDIQIYRPGQFRKNSSAGQNKDGNSESSSKSGTEKK